MKRIPLYLQILAGMVLGLLLGFVAVHGGWAGAVTDWIKPFGEIFIRLLKMIAVPLVFLSLVKGVGSLSDIASLSRIGFRTIGIYIATTVLAICVGLALVNTIRPGAVVSDESAAAMQQTYLVNVAERQASAESAADLPPLQFLVDMVPDNLVGAAGSNNNMLQIIVIALLIGAAVLLVGKDRSGPFMAFVSSFNDVVIKLIDLVMKVAPVGVFALMAGLVADTAGNGELLGALGLYVLTVALGLLLMILLFYPLIVRLFSKQKPATFLREMLPVQMLAFTTSSSAATLPLNLETVQRKLGISERVASFVLPVGMTINMDGTSLYQAVAAVFIAQVLGIDLGWTGMLVIVATCTLSSIGTPGIPGGSIVVLLMVLGAVGIPAEGLALILGLDRPLDMLRTVVNVTGDAAVATVVDAHTPPETEK